MKSLKQKVNVSLDQELFEKLKFLASAHERSLSQYMNLVLKHHLEHLDKKESYLFGLLSVSINEQLPRIESKPLKKKVSVTLDGDMLEALRKVAEECDRPLSQYINLVMKEHIKGLKQDAESADKNTSD